MKTTTLAWLMTCTLVAGCAATNEEVASSEAEVSARDGDYTTYMNLYPGGAGRSRLEVDVFRQNRPAALRPGSASLGFASAEGALGDATTVNGHYALFDIDFARSPGTPLASSHPIHSFFEPLEATVTVDQPRATCRASARLRMTGSTWLVEEHAPAGEPLFDDGAGGQTSYAAALVALADRFYELQAIDGKLERQRRAIAQGHAVAPADELTDAQKQLDAQRKAWIAARDGFRATYGIALETRGRVLDAATEAYGIDLVLTSTDASFVPSPSGAGVRPWTESPWGSTGAVPPPNTPCDSSFGACNGEPSPEPAPGLPASCTEMVAPRVLLDARRSPAAMPFAPFAVPSCDGAVTIPLGRPDLLQNLYVRQSVDLHSGAVCDGDPLASCAAPRLIVYVRPAPGAATKAYVGRLSTGIDFAPEPASVRCDAP